MRCCSFVLNLAVLVLIVQDGWGQTDQTDLRLRRREKQRYRLAELARASTSFGVNLYRELAARDNSNIIFSPFSVFTALSMTLLGTDGITKSQLRAVLVQRPRQGIHQALHAVFASFPSSPDANVTLRVANAVYYDAQQVSITDSFNRNVRRLYGAYPRMFERPNPEIPINNWIYSQTGGKIQDFFNPGDITSDLVLILLNAVYFQGKWKDKFDERSTQDGDFTTASGQVVRVPMMSRTGRYPVKMLGGELGALVLELPYGNDGRFSMFVLLPTQVNGLSDVEARLTSRLLEEAVSNMPQATRVRVQMPKFTLRVKTSMKSVLQAMGLTDLFSGSAQLSRMATSRRPLAVNDVKHEAVIEVDEKGTIAAAVTSVEIMLLSGPLSVLVNHPFLLILRDNEARLNLFMGRVNDPSLQA